MHNPDEGNFEVSEEFKELWKKQQEKINEAPENEKEEMRKHWRIFSKGEKVSVEGIPMIVKNITTEMLILRPLRKSEK